MHQLLHQTFDFGRLVFISEVEVVCVMRWFTVFVENFGPGVPVEVAMHEVVEDDSQVPGEALLAFWFAGQHLGSKIQVNWLFEGLFVFELDDESLWILLLPVVDGDFSWVQRTRAASFGQSAVDSFGKPQHHVVSPFRRVSEHLHEVSALDSFLLKGQFVGRREQLDRTRYVLRGVSAV